MVLTRQRDRHCCCGSSIFTGPDALTWTWFPPLAPRPRGEDGWAHPSVADAGAVRAARDLTASACQRWGMTARGRDIEIVVSELLTNALLHARPPAASWHGWPVRLGLLQAGPCVLLAVADPSPDPPVPKDPGSLGETGRGLRIVAALSDRWGYCVHTGPGNQEKFVWALFLRDR